MIIGQPKPDQWEAVVYVQILGWNLFLLGYVIGSVLWLNNILNSQSTLKQFDIIWMYCVHVHVCDGVASRHTFLAIIPRGWGPWFVAFPNLSGVNTSIVAKFKVPMEHHWMWSWEEICTTSSQKPSKQASAHQFVGDGDGAEGG